MAEAHSKFSASAASRWLACPGSVVLSVGKKDTPSRHAAEGTVAHGLLECMLLDQPVAPPGTVVEQDGFDIEVTGEMTDFVDKVHANILEMAGDYDLLQAETRVNYSAWLDVPKDDAWGTADAIVLRGDELQVHDLKYGRGVEVDAEGNEQMMLYAGGALLEFEAFAEIKTVRLVIHQPRIKSAPSEWSITVDELKAWLTGRARSGANSVVQAKALGQHPAFGETFLRPGEKQCRWCKAKASCPALRAEVAETVGGAEDVTELFQPMLDDMHQVPEKQLAVCLSKVDMIEDWCKAVRAEAERRLLAGESVPGFKVVQGKRGNRAWSNADEAEALLKTFRLKQEEMYEFKLISPTTAEKLAKAETIGKRQWPKLQALITQPEGKPHVAPASDPRPALEIKPVDELFEPQGESADLSNLV